MNPILFLAGRIGKISTGTTQSGKLFVNFSVGSNTGEKDEGGKFKTEWTNVVVYGQSAEYIGNNWNVGDTVNVLARKRTRSYQKDGKTVYATDYISIQADRLSKGQHSNGNSGDSAVESAIAGMGSDVAPDDEIPF